jgi:formamidopyrimidine-DNA glycosylase
VERVEAFLQRRARSPIKAVLLMQECFPGIGNWMADEILWRARIHPSTEAGRVARAAKCVWDKVRWVTAGALRIVAQDYSDPPRSWLFPHRWRDGGTCPRDGTELKRDEVGGRTTAWCVECQPAGRRKLRKLREHLRSKIPKSSKLQRPS